MSYKKSFESKFFLLIILLGITSTGIAQCPEDTDGFTRFSTQIEIDAFSEAYPNCTTVLGLRIVGSTNSAITNLEKLQQITTIGSGGILIDNNAQLTSLIGLDNVRSIEGDAIIQNNTALIDLKGLDQVEQIEGNLILKDNINLISITALSRLNILGGFELRNSSLSDLQGLERITSIEQDIFIRNNPLLEDISAFQNLTVILGTLWIWESPLIRDLDDLQNLTTLSAISLRLNENLSTCELPVLCNLVGQTAAELVIRENGCGCNSLSEVAAACNGFEGLPTCVSRDISIALGPDFEVLISPEAIDAGSSDDCSFERFLDRTAFDCNDIGDNPVTLSIIDNEGNSATCNAIVTITEGAISCSEAPVILSLPNLDFPCEGNLLTIPVTVENFNQITSLQLSLNWDASALQYSAVSTIGIPSISIENDFVLSDVAEGVLTFGWLEPNLRPMDITDGAILFELEMEVLDKKTTDIILSNTPIVIDAGDENLQSKEVEVINGTIVEQDCPQAEPIDTLPKSACCPDLENLLLNGDFEQGNILFESDYQYEPSIQSDVVLPGNYGVITGEEAQSICPVWLLDDHTTNCDGLGNVLVVNGHTGQNATAVIWEQQIASLELDTEYSLCGYLKNLQQCCFDVTPILYVKVDGQVVDTLQLNLSSAADPCSWQEFNTSFIASNSTQTISLCLDESTLGDGNDLAIDDLSLNQIPLTDFFLSVQDQRPMLPEITASINLIGTADDTLPNPECTYDWTIALVDSININTQNIFLNPTNMMMGNAATGWGLTTSFPGYSSGASGGGIGEGMYYIALEMSNCACAGDKKEEKIVGWRWNQIQAASDNVTWQLSTSSLQSLQSHQTNFINLPIDEDD